MVVNFLKQNGTLCFWTISPTQQKELVATSHEAFEVCHPGITSVASEHAKKIKVKLYYRRVYQNENNA